MQAKREAEATEVRKIGMYAMTVKGLPSRYIHLLNFSLISSLMASLANWDLLQNYKPGWNKRAVDRAGGFENEEGSITNWSLLVIKMA